MIGKESTSDNRKIARPESATTMLAHIICDCDVQDVDNEVSVIIVTINIIEFIIIINRENMP